MEVATAPTTRRWREAGKHSCELTNAVLRSRIRNKKLPQIDQTLSFLPSGHVEGSGFFRPKIREEKKSEYFTLLTKVRKIKHQ